MLNSGEDYLLAVDVSKDDVPVLVIYRKIYNRLEHVNTITGDEAVELTERLLNNKEKDGLKNE